MSNSPEPTKFKIWGQRWYVPKVSGEAARKSKLLFSVAEEHPKWLCWYIWPLLSEPFSLHQLHNTKRFVPKLLER